MALLPAPAELPPPDDTAAAALLLRHASIVLRRAWLGANVVDANCWPVRGEVVLCRNHSSIFARSYVCPSTVLTGSTIILNVMGHSRVELSNDDCMVSNRCVLVAGVAVACNNSTQSYGRELSTQSDGWELSTQSDG